MLKTLAVAVLLAGLSGAGAAQAAPPAHKALGSEVSRDSGITLVQHRHQGKRHHGRSHNRWNRHHGHHNWRGHRGWRNGPPRGWRRYHSRPWNYRARGCVMFGPVWFCP